MGLDNGISIKEGTPLTPTTAFRIAEPGFVVKINVLRTLRARLPLYKKRALVVPLFFNEAHIKHENYR